MANYFESLGYKKGDSVALFMENRPEFVTIWLGLAKIGVVPAFINYNLRHESLVHSVKVANCKAIIFGAELFDGKIYFSFVLKPRKQTAPFFQPSPM